MFYCNLIRYVLAVRGLHASRVGPDAQAGSWVEPSRPLCPINSFPKPGFQAAYRVPIARPCKSWLGAAEDSPD